MSLAIEHGCMVLNRRLADDPWAGSQGLGVVADRPDMDLPLFDGLAVWVTYLHGPDTKHITLLSDLTLVAPSFTWPSTRSQDTYAIDPDEWSDDPAPDLETDPNWVPSHRQGVDLYGGYLDEVWWNSNHMSGSAIDINRGGDTTYVPPTWRDRLRDWWHDRVTYPAKAPRRWFARKIYPPISAVERTIDHWRWS